MLWSTPRLIVLVREFPPERLLSGCKGTSGSSPNSQDWNCLYGAAGWPEGEPGSTRCLGCWSAGDS
jgi:hypothetical protein